MASRTRLGVIGCGQMARALLTGFSKEGSMFSSLLLYDIDPAKSEALADEFGGTTKENSRSIAEEADLILLAVKPAQIVPVLCDIESVLHEERLLVSVAAGISTAKIVHEVGKHVAVVRVMPNTPSLIGMGATAVAFGSSVAEGDKELIIKMFSTVGIVESVPESYMDAITAVSGSGPAYVFLVAEAMTDAAVEVGIPRDLARRLVNQTLTGSVAMMQTEGKHPALLREQVASPGGTTIAGIRALETGGIRAAFFEAVNAAYQRSKILGQ